MTWYRFVGAGIFTIAWYHYRGTLNLRHLFSRPLIAFTCIASAGLILNYISYALGLHFSTPEASQVTIQLAPLLLLLASVIWLGEDFSRQQAIGLVLVVAGLVLFFNQRFDEMLSGTNPRYLMGVGLIVVAAITWAAYGFFQKKLLEHVGVSPLDLRLRQARDKARILFEKAWSHSATKGVSMGDDETAGLYLYCLSWALGQSGVEVPDNFLPQDERLKSIIREIIS